MCPDDGSRTLIITLIDAFVRDRHAKHGPVSSLFIANFWQGVWSKHSLVMLLLAFFFLSSRKKHHNLCWFNSAHLSTADSLFDYIFLLHPCPPHQQPLYYLSTLEQAGGSRSRSVIWWTTLVPVVQDGEGMVLRVSEDLQPTVHPSHHSR